MGSTTVSQQSSMAAASMISGLQPQQATTATPSSSQYSVMFGMESNLQPQMATGPTQSSAAFMGMSNPVVPQPQTTQVNQPPPMLNQQNEPLVPSKLYSVQPKSNMNGIQV